MKSWEFLMIWFLRVQHLLASWIVLSSWPNGSPIWEEEDGLGWLLPILGGCSHGMSHLVAPPPLLPFQFGGAKVGHSGWGGGGVKCVPFLNYLLQKMCTLDT